MTMKSRYPFLLMHSLIRPKVVSSVFQMAAKGIPQDYSIKQLFSINHSVSKILMKHTWLHQLTSLGYQKREISGKTLWIEVVIAVLTIYVLILREAV